MRHYYNFPILTAAVIFLLLPKDSASQIGQLDTTFGQGGIVNTAFNPTGNCQAYSMAIQSDGKIVAAASSQNNGHSEFALVRYYQDGRIDQGFGTNGVVTSQVGSGNNVAKSISIQSDGKIVAGGYASIGGHYEFAVVRYNPNGSLDNTFGTNGIITTAIGDSDDGINSVVIQVDGKIVVAGSSLGPSYFPYYAFALARYNADGSLDNTFGVNGILVSKIDAFNYYATSVAIQSNGKIIVGGYVYLLVGTLPDINYYGNFVLERLNSNGTIDSTFGTNGVVATVIGTPGRDIADVNTVLIQKDGKIVAAGFYTAYLIGADDDFALVRYDTSGVLDNSFGTNGIVLTYLSGISGANSAALQDDGKIVAGGNGGTSAANYFALIRYNTDGSLDNTFGISGISNFEIGYSSDEVASIAIQKDGKILAAGSYYDGGFDELALARYNLTGTIDNTFGTNGFVISSVGNSNDATNSLALQTDGKLVVAGSSNNGTASIFTVLRYNSNGTLDRFWGTGGAAATSIGTSNSQANAVVIQSDEAVVAAGYYFDGKNNDFAVVRYTPSGAPDNAFGTNGIATTPIGSLDDEATSVALQNDGRIVAAGYSQGTYFQFALVRYAANGALDNTFGTDGIVTTKVGASHSFAQAVAIQKDGKIVAVGSSQTGSNYEFAVVRFNVDGSLDNTFGTGGIVLTPIDTASFGYSVAIELDGKIAVAGYATNGGNYAIALARYNSNGSLDNSFGTNGIVTTEIGTTSDFAYSAAIQGDGKIVAAGYSEDGSEDEIVVVRYDTNGVLDSTFGTNGFLATQTGQSNSYARSVAIQSDGKIVAGGYSSALGAYNYKVFTLVRYDIGTATGLKGASNFSTPNSFRLSQNYPNPFNPVTTINYQLPINSHVTLKVFDVLGREVTTLVNGKENSGGYSVKFDGSRLASGVYFYMLEAGSFSSVKKLVVLK